LPKSNVVAIDLSVHSAAKLIKELAECSERVFFSKHAKKRMIERDITRVQILRCLKTGIISEGPAKSVKGNWEITVSGISAGNSINVVTALDKDSNGDYALIVTAYFE